ncbi:pilus assembly protein [Vibrio cincinnatiensis]|uniref:TadE/TadG family type IV pilus assembly protein n=1 Tax=Vibrio cincinnatiensis TaxID=675 RepID=UPI001EDF1F1F|nr:TadE/TadG family type IV pilus assembly protein [Vibrio cincinnatiensis]MCG3765498.1 pilus assembly protein [Vibrio cincinnatiensis]
MIHRIQKQSGHAAILFALFIPILFGVFALGTDGARAIQDKARLLEAVEVASLAVAGQGSDDKTLAKSYVQYYFPLATVEDKDISITKLNCEDNSNCRNQERRFFEYRVTASITQPTWFPGNESIIGFGESYQVSDGSITRKYHSETVDVILVADFSASMYDFWDGGSQRKFLDLKDIIKVIAHELELFNGYTKDESNKNRLAIVGFDFYTIQRSGNTRAFRDHLICRGSANSSHSSYLKEVKCDSYYPGRNSDLINETATVRDIFTPDSIAHQAISSNRVTNVSYFEDILLTEDMESITDRIFSSNFSIPRNSGSGTSSYAGLIRGAQMAYHQGENPRQLIIILSDGQDSYRSTTNKLINANLCSTIHTALNSKTSADGNVVNARLAAVGFDYELEKYPEMGSCVGQENVFKAENQNDIINKILELITEEIGHLAR